MPSPPPPDDDLRAGTPASGIPASDTAASDTPVDAAPRPTGLRARWRALRRARWFRWLTDIAFVLIVVQLVTTLRSASPIGAGEPAPALRLSSLDGTTHAIGGGGGGGPGRRTVVSFWAPWCGVCGAEADNVGRARGWLGDRADVVSVALGWRERAEVEAFARDHAIDYPVLLGDAATAAAYDISMFPTLLVIDADGRIEHRVSGYTTTLGMLWRAWF